MNDHNKLHQSSSPEQQRRDEVVGELLRDSEGSVAIYTSADLDPQDRQAMLAAQSERIGQPADVLSNNRGGWNDYGERKAVEPRTGHGEDNAETVKFVTLENGDIDVRYGFWQSGYSDATGRPGNTLNVQFVLRPENAAILKQSLEADPSFINDVIEAQAKALGVSEKQWSTKMEPHYEVGFKTTVEQKDRLLDIKDVDASGNISTEEALIYGENKSLATELISPHEQAPHYGEAIAEVPMQESAPNQDGYMDDAEWDEQVKKSEQIVQEDIDFYESEGRTTEEMIALLSESVKKDETDMIDKSLPMSNQEKAATYALAGRKMLKELEQRQIQHGQTAEARSEVAQLFSETETEGPKAGATVALNGEPVKISETYSDASGNQWLELTDGRQVMASKVTTQ